jgi:hypothetical protein
LQQIRLQVSAARDFKHLVNGGKRYVMLQMMILRDEEPVLFVQVFKPQQSANTLIERVFVSGQGGSPREWAKN